MLNAKRELHIDIETYSDVPLGGTKGQGLYKYVESPNFEVLIFAWKYKIDGAWDGPVRVIDMTETFPPRGVLRDLTDRHVLKVAFNAQFERVCLSKYIGLRGRYLPPEQWRDTMILSVEVGYPRSLDELGAALNDAGFQKDKRGKALIQKFSKPCRPTKANGGRTRNLPEHFPEDWAVFMYYCGQDVDVEGAAEDKLLKLGVDENEQRHWYVDQRINDRGVVVDQKLVHKVLDFRGYFQENLTADLKRITQLDNPNSPAQLKSWFAAMGYPMESLAKEAVADAIRDLEARGEGKGHKTNWKLKDVWRVLTLRKTGALSSLAKYDKMLDVMELDGRIRGLFAFYGAVRTGRYAGRLVQIQNLPRNYLKDIEGAREITREAPRDQMYKSFDDPLDICKQLIRTALIPSPGHRFVVADFASIESRVLAWVAGEKWKIEVFRTTGKIYEANAERMFGVPADQIDHSSPLRQRGKVAELACGYQGAESAMERMDFKHEIDPTEYRKIVDDWRRANPGVVKLWSAMESAAITSIRDRTSVRVNKYVAFSYSKGFLWMHLPSGRRLAYPKAFLENNRFGRPAVHFRGKNDEDKYSKAWGVIDTYGGKLVENLIQATARDLLADALDRIEYGDNPYKAVGHVHDEIITEAPIGQGSVTNLVAIMSKKPAWADDDLILDAAGFESGFYKKD